MNQPPVADRITGWSTFVNIRWVPTLAVLVTAVALAGCGSPPAAEDDQPERSRLEEKTEISLADLLAKPRSELAEMADELATRARLQENARREGKFQFSLLPDLRLPLAVPVWRE